MIPRLISNRRWFWDLGEPWVVKICNLGMSDISLILYVSFNLKFESANLQYDSHFHVELVLRLGICRSTQLQGRVFSNPSRRQCGECDNPCSWSICCRPRVRKEIVSGMVSWTDSWLGLLHVLHVWALDVSKQHSFLKPSKLFHDKEIWNPSRKNRAFLGPNSEGPGCSVRIPGCGYIHCSSYQLNAIMRADNLRFFNAVLFRSFGLICRSWSGGIILICKYGYDCAN